MTHPSQTDPAGTPQARSPRLAVLVASVRGGRFAPRIVDWFSDRTAAHGGFDVDLIDLRDAVLPLEMPPPGQRPDPGTRQVVDRLTPRLTEADAFAVVTPEYNHSFPAALKNTIDWFLPVWQAKPVGFVSYGGISGGLRAVEQLRLVFAELHAVTVRHTVSFAFPWDQFGDDGSPGPDDASAVAAKQLLDQLEWWSEALREARSRRPYPG